MLTLIHSPLSMKTSFQKRSRKPPRSAEQEAPFFSPNGPQRPFFQSTQGAIAQPKLTVSQPGDAFEQEADAMAQSVVKSASPAQTTPPTEPQIHRQAEEEEPVQTKSELMRAEEEEEPVQAKPDVMRATEEEEPVQTKSELMRAEEEEEPVQAKPDVMRAAEEEEEPVQAKPDVMRMDEQTEEEPVQAKSETPQSAKPDLTQQLKQQKGQGKSLPKSIQQEMATAFNYDFSDVKIHTGTEAVQMTRQLHALAFTHGQDIYFNEGKYDPESESGKQLLAHELTHVVQQNPGSAS